MKYVKVDPNRTTKQLESMPDHSLFIGDVPTVIDLVRKIGGTYRHAENIWTKLDGSTVFIERRSALTTLGAERHAGREYSKITLDHFIQETLKDEEVRPLSKLKERERPEQFGGGKTMRRP